MDQATGAKAGFDAGAAVTRSILGWGVVAGPFYLLVGTILAATRDGFDLSRHQLSLLMLGEGGWLQRTNLILSGLMTLAAAVGFWRVSRLPDVPRARAVYVAGLLVGVYGLGLLGSGTFAPDPMRGFPPGAAEVATASGIAHLAFGVVQFVALAAAAFVLARGLGGRMTWYSRATGAVILVGFAGGAALATSSAGVALLWLAVVAGWAWLLVTSIHLYRLVPHPDADRRA
jgi:hypothetical protein